MIPVKPVGESVQDDVPGASPQTVPKSVGYGHPEFNFVQGLMELNGSVARMQAVLEQVKQTTDDTKGKFAYAATAIIVIAVAMGGWALNAAKDFAFLYYRASLEAQAKQSPSSPPAPPPAPAPAPAPTSKPR